MWVIVVEIKLNLETIEIVQECSLGILYIHNYEQWNYKENTILWSIWLLFIVEFTRVDHGKRFDFVAELEKKKQLVAKQFKGWIIQ